MRTRLPEDVGNAEDAEQLLGSRPGSGVFDAGDDGAVSLRPDVTSPFHQDPIVAADRQTLQTHCGGIESSYGGILCWAPRVDPDRSQLLHTVQVVLGEGVSVQRVTHFIDGATQQLLRPVT